MIILYSLLDSLVENFLMKILRQDNPKIKIKLSIKTTLLFVLGRQLMKFIVFIELIAI